MWTTKKRLLAPLFLSPMVYIKQARLMCLKKTKSLRGCRGRLWWRNSLWMWGLHVLVCVQYIYIYCMYIYYLTTVVQDSTVAEWRPSAAIYAYWKEHICSCRMISANRKIEFHAYYQCYIILIMLLNFLCFVNTNLNQWRFFYVTVSSIHSITSLFQQVHKSCFCCCINSSPFIAKILQSL